jgi:hypothetical protein
LYKEVELNKAAVSASLSEILGAELGFTVDSQADLISQIGTDSLSSIKLVNILKVLVTLNGSRNNLEMYNYNNLYFFA